MVCCAFAVMLLGWLIAPFAGLLRRFGLLRERGPDAAVMWSPGHGLPPVRQPRRFRRAVLALAASGGIAALAITSAGAVASTGHPAPDRLQSILARILICHSS